MSDMEKSKILTLVAGSPLLPRHTLSQLGLAKSTYYRWLRRQTEEKLEDKKGSSKLSWNRLRPEEEAAILLWARASPELSPDN